jgi:hypothetical protein
MISSVPFIFGANVLLFVLSGNVHGLFVLAQRDEAGVPQVKVGGPFDKLELADENRFQPPAGHGTECITMPALNAV